MQRPCLVCSVGPENYWNAKSRNRFGLGPMQPVMTNRDLPVATIAGRRDWQTLARGLAIAAAFGFCAAMFAANAIGGLIVVVVIAALWMHRRYVLTIDDRAPRASHREPQPVPPSPSPSESEDGTPLQWFIAYAVFGIVMAVQVPWSSLLDETTIAAVLIVGTMAMAFRR